MKLISAFSLVAFLACSAFGQQIKFDASNAKVSFFFHGDKVDGTVDGFDAVIKFDPSKPESAEISGSVKAGTINTSNKMRDKHLASDDFFKAEKFPKMTFKATQILKEDGYFLVNGKLTITDVVRDETFKLTMKEGKMIFKSTINSADYGIMKKKKRDDSKVDITIEVPLL